MFDIFNDNARYGGVDGGPSIPEIIPDAIGIKIEPTLNFAHQVFFAMVHIYLMLLLVTSLPGSDNTRLVKRRFTDIENFAIKESKQHGTTFDAMSKLC